MPEQSWMGRQVDLLLNQEMANDNRPDTEILRDLTQFVRCAEELTKRDPTTREKLYLGYLEMLYNAAGLEGAFDFYALENKILELQDRKPVKLRKLCFSATTRGEREEMIQVREEDIEDILAAGYQVEVCDGKTNS